MTEVVKLKRSFLIYSTSTSFGRLTYAGYVKSVLCSRMPSITDNTGNGRAIELSGGIFEQCRVESYIHLESSLQRQLLDFPSTLGLLKSFGFLI